MEEIREYELAGALPLLRIAAPADLGGLGDPWEKFAEEFQKSAPVHGLGWMVAVASQAWALKGVLDHGSPEQQDAIVPAVLAGKWIGTALAEPQSGSDMARLITILLHDAQGYKLSGAKRNISLAAEATYMLVLAREADGGPHRLVILNRNFHPWLVTEAPEKLGLHDLPVADLAFSDLLVTEIDVLAPQQPAATTLTSFMTFGRALLGIGAMAVLHAHIQAAMKHAGLRQSAGQSILQQQFVQAKLTDVQSLCTQAALLSWRALSAHLGGEAAAVGLGSMAKIAATKALVSGSQILASLYGTEGYQVGEAGQLSVDALAFQAIGGTEEVHRINIFKQMQAGHL